MQLHFYILALIAGALFSTLLPRFIRSFSKNERFLIENYQGKKLPAGGFALIILIFVAFSSFVMVVHLVDPLSSEFVRSYALFAIISGALASTIVGIFDDLSPVNEKGFKGHLKALLKGKITPGNLKVIVIGAAAVTVSFILSKDYTNLVVNVLLISLTSNAVNLLDLRPGRALKSHFFFLLLTLIAAIVNIDHLYLPSLTFFWLCWMCPALLFLILDLRKKVILGDAGSNPAGFILGATWAAFDSIIPKVFLLGLVILVNAYAEFGSITKLIERSTYLKKLDNLGLKE